MISIEGQERPWGRFFVMHDQPSYKLKSIEGDPGGRLSYQHHHKTIFWSSFRTMNLARLWVGAKTMFFP